MKSEFTERSEKSFTYTYIRIVNTVMSILAKLTTWNKE